MAKSFVFLKPDTAKRNLIGEIIKRFEERGLKVTKLEMLMAPKEIIDIHYPLNNRDYILTLGHADIEGKSEEELEAIYNKNHKVIEDLQKYVMSGPIVKMILESDRDDTVALIREIVGKTNPPASPKGTIRGDLGIDSFEKSDAEGRACENLVHASGNNEEAEAEIKLWFPE
jgi:nucleoside-diphosphate kinase